MNFDDDDDDDDDDDIYRSVFLSFVLYFIGVHIFFGFL